MMTTQEVAEKYRKSAKTIRRWINTGIYGRKLYAKRVGRDYRINEQTLESFFYSLRNLGVMHGENASRGKAVRNEP